MEYFIQQQLKHKEHFLLHSVRLVLPYTKPDEVIGEKLHKSSHQQRPKIVNKIFASEFKNAGKNYTPSTTYTREATEIQHSKKSM